MNEHMIIKNQAIEIKEYGGKRVVTFKDVDTIHGRPEGTARKRFSDNRKHFVEGIDFYKITPSEFRTAIGEMDARQSNDVTLLTESGYMMVVKSFNDDLAWDVQRELVNSYFRAKNAELNLQNLSPELRLLIKLELNQKMQEEKLELVSRRVDDIGNVINIDPTTGATTAGVSFTGSPKREAASSMSRWSIMRSINSSKLVPGSTSPPA